MAAQTVVLHMETRGHPASPDRSERILCVLAMGSSGCWAVSRSNRCSASISAPSGWLGVTGFKQLLGKPNEINPEGSWTYSDVSGFQSLTFKVADERIQGIRWTAEID